MKSHRKDELYGLGGFDPTHPSGNVLDEFDHGTVDHDSDGLPGTGRTVIVRHYERDGSLAEDRTLTPEERAFFFPAPGESVDLRAHLAVRELGNARVTNRL